MSLGPAFRASYRTLLARPTEVLPTYVVALGAPVLSQVVFLAGIVLAYRTASAGGHLDPLRRELESAAPIPLDDPEGTELSATALEDALTEVMTPTLVAILLGTVVLALVVVTVATAIVSAGRFHAVYAVVSDRPATPAAVDGLLRHWTTFVGFLLLELLVYVLGTIVLGLGVDVLGRLSPALGLLGSLFALFVVVVGGAVVRLSFAFARPAAVVDGVGLRRALRRGYGHVAGQPLEGLGYLLFAIVAFAAAGFVVQPFSAIGAGSVGSIVVVLFVLPLLDLVKTILYADAAGAGLAVPQPAEASLLSRVRRTLGAGLGELAAFARGHPGALLASTGLFAAGIGLGLQLGGRVDHLFVASIERRVAGVSPVGSFFEYAANNWSVAAAQAFGGLLVGIPTLVGLVFNGTFIGIYYRIEAEPELLLAFVAPHGLLEIPGLLLAGALGLHLGAVVVRYAAGTVDRARLAEEVERAFRVVVGLIVVFVGAALIEAFVSPYYWQLLGL